MKSIIRNSIDIERTFIEKYGRVNSFPFQMTIITFFNLEWIKIATQNCVLLFGNKSKYKFGRSNK